MEIKKSQEKSIEIKKSQWKSRKIDMKIKHFNSYLPDTAVWGTSPFSDKGVSEPHIREPILEGEVEGRDKLKPSKRDIVT